MPNPHYVQSAIARPYSGYYRPIYRKAAALVESMATNHGFADGNKRTTIILTHLLLARSGYVLRPLNADEDPVKAIEDLVLDVVTGRIDFEGISAWFKQRLFALCLGRG
jgi:death-on-curing protein